MWRSIADFLVDARNLGADAFLKEHSVPVLVARRPPPGKTNSEFETVTSQPRPSIHPRVQPMPSDAAEYSVHELRKGSRSMYTTHISIGRTQAADVCIPHPSVSKFHAYFMRSEADETGGYLLGDGASRNGTRLDGTLLKARTPVPVRSGALLGFGEIEAIFLFPAEFLEFLQRMQTKES